MVFLQIVEITDIFVITFVFNRANIRTTIGMFPSKKIVFSVRKSIVMVFRAKFHHESRDAL